jgi:hypothetical protein
MKRYISRYVLIARLAALALSALCLLQAPARAQETTCNVIFPPVGLAPFHSLSLTFFNPNGTPVRAQAQIQNSGGMQVALGDGSVRFLQASIQAGASYSFKLSHHDILLPCYESTCRKQILASVSLTFPEANKPVIASAEIIDVRDGTSNTVFIGEILPSQAGGSGNDFLNSGFGNDIMMGIPTGHMLLVTLFNPRLPGSDYVPSRVKLYESNGSLISQSPELVIPRGEFRLFKFDPNQITLSVDPGVNRAHVRIKPFFRFESGRLSPVLASFEIVDISTGRTVQFATNAMFQSGVLTVVGQ